MNLIFWAQSYIDLHPTPFDNFFTKRSDIHYCHTRNKSDNNQTRNRKVFTDQAVRTTGPILWNAVMTTSKMLIQLNILGKTQTITDLILQLVCLLVDILFIRLV